MADRYWVGGSANWDGTADSKWATSSGGAGGAAVPTSSDNVFFDAASGAVTVTVSTGNTGCANFTATGFTGTIAGTAALTVNGNFTLAAGLTWTCNSALTFTGTGSQTFDSAGKTLANHHTFQAGAGTYTLQAALVMGTSAILTLNSGTLDANEFDITCPGGFSSSNTATRAFNITGSTVTITAGGSTGWNTTISTNMTLTVDTDTHIVNPSLFQGGGLTYNDVTMAPNTSSMPVTGANTFRNFTCNTITPHASVGLNFSANQTFTGTLTLTGSTAVSRAFARGVTIGTPITLTAAVVSLQDVDFQDITAAGAAAPFTGTRLGNCKGNTDITFTAASDKYWVGGTAAWGGASSWAASSGGAASIDNYPLPQDTCIFDANSFSANDQIATISFSRVGTIDFSAVTHTGITLNAGSAFQVYGDVTFNAGNATTTNMAAQWVGRTTQSLTSAGSTYNTTTIDSPGGTLQLVDDASWLFSLILTRGTFDLNGQIATIAGSFSASNNNTKGIKSSSNGGKLITTSTTAGAVVVNVFATGTTIDRATGSWTIEIGGNTTNMRQVTSGAGLVWPALTFTNTTANGELNITGSATYKSIAVSVPPQTIEFAGSSTTTIEDVNGFPSGTDGSNLVTIGSIVASNHTLVKSGGGQIECNFLSISRSTATPADTWFAGGDSTDGGNNSGWDFSAAPELMSAAQGSFALNGQAVEFIVRLPVAQGSYVLDGQEILLDGSFSLDMEHGSFTLTGQASSGGVNSDYNHGSFTLTHQQVSEDGDFIPVIWSDNASDTGTRLSINTAGTQLTLKLNGTSYFSDEFFPILGDEEFHHVAVTRSGTTIYFWLDGEAIGTATDSTNVSSSNAVKIGSRLTGHLDDIRVTKAARYTESFTLPREHPDQ